VDCDWSDGSRSEHVSQQKSTVSASAPAVIVNETPAVIVDETQSHPQRLMTIPDNKKAKVVPSEPNIQLLQPHGDDANADEKTYSGQQPSHVSQVTSDARPTIEEIPSEPNTQLLQPLDSEADKNKTQYHHVAPLFVSDVTGDTRLTIEDIYIEAMTLAAEIRIHHRQLDDKGRAELTRIMEFCHDALHEKLVLSSLAKRSHGGKWRV